MLLAIDAGNTNIVFAVMDGERIAHKWRISTASARTADEYMVWISQLMALAKVKAAAIDAAIIATVVPSTLFHLRQLCQSYFNVTPMVVGDSGVVLGLGVRVPNPAEVGADRLVNAVGGFARHGGPLILIDFGTATTFDVVDGEGDYHGGVIAPGINLSMDALHRAAAKLPKVAVEVPKSGHVIGTTTIEAMQSGVVWGYIGLIEGLVDRITAEWGARLKVVATGGLAPVFDAQSQVIDVVDPDLTLHGLALVHARNKGP
ncbi:MAG: type III pantothenate kinase [Pseudomonadota bacterium]|jgi:type III pantothenate kinase